MQKLYAFIFAFLRCPVALFGLITFVCAFSLSMAFIAELFFGLEPCVMCIYQRWPFAIGIALGITGLALRKSDKAVRGLLALCALDFLTNSGLAFYHTGIEQHWWKSVFESCAIPDFSKDLSTQTMLENIMSAPTAPCDVIPWQDPILDLSMANYNVLLCLGLFAMCVLALWIRIRPTASGRPVQPE